MSLFRAALAPAVVLAHPGCVYGNCMTGGMATAQAFLVSLELMFYAVAPFIGRRSAVVVALLVSGSVGARLIVDRLGYDCDPYLYRFFSFRTGAVV